MIKMKKNFKTRDRNDLSFISQKLLSEGFVNNISFAYFDNDITDNGVIAAKIIKDNGKVLLLVNDNIDYRETLVVLNAVLNESLKKEAKIHSKINNSSINNPVTLNYNPPFSNKLAIV